MSQIAEEAGNQLFEELGCNFSIGPPMRRSHMELLLHFWAISKEDWACLVCQSPLCQKGQEGWELVTHHLAYPDSSGFDFAAWLDFGTE
jgi:hypothetical protein